MELLNIATSHASGEEAIGMIFDRPKGTAKRDEDVSEGASNRPNKKKNKQRRGGSLVATTDRKGGWKPTEGILDHFEKLIKGPCPNHSFSIKHLYKDCVLMKRFLSGGSNNGEHRKEPNLDVDDTEGKDGGFPALDGYLIIFRGSTAYDSKHCQKLVHREVYTAKPTTPFFL